MNDFTSLTASVSLLVKGQKNSVHPKGLEDGAGEASAAPSSLTSVPARAAPAAGGAYVPVL